MYAKLSKLSSYIYTNTVTIYIHHTSYYFLSYTHLIFRIYLLSSHLNVFFSLSTNFYLYLKLLFFLCTYTFSPSSWSLYLKLKIINNMRRREYKCHLTFSTLEQMFCYYGWNLGVSFSTCCLIVSGIWLYGIWGFDWQLTSQTYLVNLFFYKGKILT